MSNSEVSPVGLKSENNFHEIAAGNDNESQLTSAINECFNNLHQSLSEIKYIVQNNKEVVSIVPKPIRQLGPSTPRIRVLVKSIRRRGCNKELFLVGVTSNDSNNVKIRICRPKDVRIDHHRIYKQKMINKEHEKRESNENNDQNGSLINQNSSDNSSPKDITPSTIRRRESNGDLKKECINESDGPRRFRDTLDSSAVKSDANEIEDIVQTIGNAVFRIIDNNFDQLANRSSNTLGMRVKDSLILKVQQTNKKQIPFDELRTSLVPRLIVDDDLQIRFLPRIESPATSSDSENLSTKRKKSVSLAEEVKDFNQVENEFFSQNEVGFFNELTDSQNGRIMDQQKSTENDDRMYDFTSQKSSTSPLGSKGSMDSNNLNLQKLNNECENFSTELIDRENERRNKLSKTVNQNSDESSENDTEPIEQTDLTTLTKKPLIFNVDVEMQFEEEQSMGHDAGRSESQESKNAPNSFKSNRNEDSDDNSRSSDVMKAKKVFREESSIEKTCRTGEDAKSSIECLDIVDKTVGENSSEEKKQTKQIKKLMNEFLHSHRKPIGDESKAENQSQQNSQSSHSFKDSKQQFSPHIAVVAIDTEAVKLDLSQPDLESNYEDRISEKGSLGVNFITFKSQIDEVTKLGSEARLNSKRPCDVDQEINDSEIPEEKEQPEISSESKLIKEDENPVNEIVRSSEDNSDQGVYKFFKKTFATANVESGIIIQTSQRDDTINEKNNPHTHSDNSLTEDNPESKSSHAIIVEKDQSMGRDISFANEFPNSSNESERINHDAMKSSERQEIVTNSEKRSSLLSRIIRSKSRTQKIIASRKAGSEELDTSKTNDPLSSDSQPLNSRKNSEIDLEDAAESLLAFEASETDEVERKNGKTVPKIESQQVEEFKYSDEKLKMKSTFDTKTDGPTNSYSWKKTLSKVSLEANKLSKESSKTDSSTNPQPINDPSSQQPSSKVSRKDSQSSRKFSVTDINEVIGSGSNNPTVETSLVSSEDRNVSGKIDKSANKGSGSSLKKISAQVYPVAADNILRSDPLRTEPLIVDNKVSQMKNVNDEIDKVEMKTNRSRWSLLSKKSSAKLKRDKREITERENLGSDTEDIGRGSMRRKKSLLNVVSRSSVEGNGVIGGNSQPEIHRDITDNQSSKASLNFKISKLRNKSEDSSIATQLYAAPVHSNDEQLDRTSEPSVNIKNRDRFLEGLKRSVQPNRNSSRKSDAQSESRLKVKSESRTDMNQELNLEFSSLTQFKDGNDIEKSTRSSEFLDTKLGRSSPKIEEDFLISGKDEAGSDSLKDVEDSYLKQKSRSLKSFLKRSIQKESKVDEIREPVEDMIQKSMSQVTKQSAEETPNNLVEVHSVPVDSVLKQNQSPTCQITDLSSEPNYSQDLGERNSCDINKSETKSIPNELELVPKASEDPEAKPAQTTKDDVSLKVNKSFVKLMQKMSSENFSKGTSKKSLNNDELSEDKDPIDESLGEKRSSKRTISVRKKSIQGIKTSKDNEVSDGEDSSRKSDPSACTKISKNTSKSGINETTVQNSLPNFTQKSESVIVAFVVKQSVQDHSGVQTLIRYEVESDSALIKNEMSDEESHDLMKRDKGRNSLLSSIKSIFKSPNRSEPQKRSVANIEEPENLEIVNKSLHSLRSNKLDASASEMDVAKDQKVHLRQESEEIPIIQSMKSLQDDRKRTKNKARPGHKLFDDEDTTFLTENLVDNSYQVATHGHSMQRQNKFEIEDFGVDGKTNDSDESVTESNSEVALTDEKEVEEKTAEAIDRRKKSKQKQDTDGNAKKFAISLSRIFSNSSRKRNGVKASRATAHSQTNPENHFEITKIPLSSSDDSSNQENDCTIRKHKSDVTGLDNREELVAVKSLDSMNGSDNHTANREAIVKRATNYRPEQSGTVIFSAPIEANPISSENELVKKDSLNSFQETKKFSEKVYVTKGTIVSYAPMVESAKYLSNECDDRSNEDEQSENSHKRSFSGKSFANIRKLFSRASIRSRQDPTAIENNSIEQIDHKIEKETLNSEKSSIIKDRKEKDHSENQLNNEAKRGSIMSAKMSSAESINDNKDEEEERKSHPTTQTRLSKSKMKIRERENTENVEGSIAHEEILLVNNVSVSQSDSAKKRKQKNEGEDLKTDLEPAAMECEETDIVEIKLEPNHGGLKPTEVVEHVVVDEILIQTPSQRDLNLTGELKKKLSRQMSETKKGSILSIAKSYIRRHSKIEKDEMEGVKQLVGENSHDEDSENTSKSQSVTKTESSFSRSLKKLFRKRSSAVDSVASNNHVENPEDEICESLNLQTLSHPWTNDIKDVTIETETLEPRKVKTKETASIDIQFAVYNLTSESKYSANREESRQNLEDDHTDLEANGSKSRISLLRNIARKSVDALSKAGSKSNKRSSIKSESTNEDIEMESSAAAAVSGTHTSTSFPTYNNPGTETFVIPDENVTQNRSRSRITTKDFRLRPSFASGRSTIVMMATPDPPRKFEPQNENSNSSNDSRDGSSSSPTAFYYLLGPSLDEALVDVRVLFQNLIDKITGRER